MIKKNSIYIKLLLPVIGIMILQSLLIGTVLFTNGTISSLKNNAIENLRGNVDSRAIALENKMVRNWSNIDLLENKTIEVIEAYAESERVTTEEILANPVAVKEILSELSDSVLSTLRLTSSTGTFIYFIDNNDINNTEPVACQAVYFRDLDPISTPADYSDVLCLKGANDIARKHKISLDSLWEEAFVITPENKEQWDIYHNLLSFSGQESELSSSDMSYWSRPYYINSQSAQDSNRCITYSRPILMNGQVVAIIGSEIQDKQLMSFFPYLDFGESGQGGYMLINYDTDSKSNDTLVCDVSEINGSYLKRMLNSSEEVTIKESDTQNNTFSFASDSLDPSQLVLHPIKLYNSNAPFSNRQWALAAVNTDRVLFAPAQSVLTGILLSSALAFVLGVIALAFIIKTITSPLTKIGNQIENNLPDEPITLNGRNAYEISLLCSTLNEMKAKRKDMDIALREERERYLLALENATETFIEYEFEKDRFLLYFFTENDASRLSTRTADNFSEKINQGFIFHPMDIDTVNNFLRNPVETPLEIRVTANLLPHITDTEPEEGYYWMVFKVSLIFDDAGTLQKLIGTARNITNQKREQIAEMEASRRDLTTGFYNAEYGNVLLDSFIKKKDLIHTFSICYVRLQLLEELEAYYGRVFAGLVLGLLSRHVNQSLDGNISVVRLSNEDFVVFLPDTQENIAAMLCQKFCSYIARVFPSEAFSRYEWKPQIGIASACNTSDYRAILRQASVAMLSSTDGVPVLHSTLSGDALNRPFTISPKPVLISLNITKENIVGITFELFESTGDIPSAIRLLLRLIGSLFDLNEVLICSYDSDFNTNHIAYQWSADSQNEQSDHIQKIDRADFDFFDTLTWENGTLLYDSDDVGSYPEGLKKLLCVKPEELFSTFCCTLYENGIHTGRILFKSTYGRVWNDAELYNLQETSKIISAHLNIEKSNNASKSKSEFLSRISHEIRTPMNAIIGMTNIAKEKLDEKERVRDCLQKIDFSANHLLLLINDVLDMSRIESGKMKIDCKPFSLDTFIESIEVLMRSPIETKGLQFTVVRDYTNAGIWGDEYRLRQVIINLLSNASKFTDTGGQVTLTIRQAANDGDLGTYLFSVRDTGVGIKLDEQMLIFQAFEQSESGIRQKGGTGLGLAISNGIINSMGSKFELHSALGEGSDFFFTLTLPFADILQPDSSPHTNQPPGFFGKHALLVEDNEINIEIAEFILKEMGFSITVAMDGQPAVDIFLQSAPGNFDIIFMDIQMPGMDGLTATREIRKSKSHPDAATIPIVAMTANAFNEDMNRSIEAGMNGHVSKPIDIEKLQELLNKIF